MRQKDAEPIQEREFFALEQLARRNLNGAFFPMNTIGKPDLALARSLAINSVVDQEAEAAGAQRISEAAIQAFSLLTGNEPLYGQQRPRNVPVIDMNEFVFVQGLEQLRIDEHVNQQLVAMDADSVRGKILELLKFSRVTVPQDKMAFSPFFTNLGDSQGQIAVTEHVHKIQQNLEAALNNGSPNLQIIPPQDRGEILVTQPFLNGELIPLTMPISTRENEFDSGSCNDLVATAFKQGTLVAPLARYTTPYGRFVLLTRQGEWYGWTPETAITQPVNPQDTDRYKREWYVGGETIFYNVGNAKQALLHTAPVFRDNAGKYFGLGKDTYGKASFFPLPQIDKNDITAQIHTPGQMVTTFARNNAPYIYGQIDCSQTLRGVFNTAGWEIAKQSGDLAVSVQKATQQAPINLTVDTIATIEPGAYICNYLYPIRGNPQNGHASRHVGLLVKTDNVSMYSHAFSEYTPEGTREYPVGLHIANQETLARHLEKNQQVQLTPLTNPK